MLNKKMEFEIKEIKDLFDEVDKEIKIEDHFEHL